jgi:peptidyl-prolyl cis-trans isomerase SurA
MKYLVVLALAASSAFAADLAIVEEIIAKCNGDVITRGDIDRSRRELVQALRREGLAGPALEKALEEQEKNLLRDRIDSLLLVQKAKDLNLSVDSELAKYMASIQKESKIADPEKFKDWVKEQAGVSYEDFKNEQKNNMLRQRAIRQEVGEKVQIKKDEIQKYYDEHKSEFIREERLYLREIFVSSEGKDPAGVAAAEKKAKDLSGRARKGERFPEMARDNSDAVTAKSYGELQPFKKGDLSKLVEDQVWSQPKGFITEPINTGNGFLILKVEEHQKAGQAELADVEQEIQEKLYAPRMTPKVREYLSELRKNAFLEIKSDWVDSAAAGKDTSWVDPGQLKPETVTKEEVANQVKHKKLLWAIPIPGTKAKSTSSSQ